MTLCVCSVPLWWGTAVLATQARENGLGASLFGCLLSEGDVRGSVGQNFISWGSSCKAVAVQRMMLAMARFLREPCWPRWVVLDLRERGRGAGNGGCAPLQVHTVPCRPRILVSLHGALPDEDFP